MILTQGTITNLTTEGDNTVVFHLKYAAPVDLIASSGYGAYIFDGDVAPAAELGDWFTAGQESGTGPYQVESWNKGQEVELRLKAFPGYWGGWEGSHYERVVFRVVPTATTAAQLIRSGQVDFVQRLGPQLWESFKSDANVATTSASSASASSTRPVPG